VDGEGAATPATTRPLGKGDALVGALIGAYAIFDSLVLIVTLIILIVLFDPLGVLLGGILVISLLNLACCRWLDRRWDAWIGSRAGRRLEARLTRLRERESMQRPIGWVTEGSIGLFAAAAAVINPILVIGAARMFGGKPVGDQRIVVASVTYASVVSALYLVVALGIRSALNWT
jgi:hypothetical protein